MLKTISPIDNSLYVEIPYASESTIENTLTSSHEAKTTWKNTRLQERKKLINELPRRAWKQYPPQKKRLINELMTN